MQQGYIAVLLNSIADGSALTNTTTATSILPVIAKPTLPANYLFADSHVETLRWVRVKENLVQPGSRFVRPDGQVN